MRVSRQPTATPFWDQVYGAEEDQLSVATGPLAAAALQHFGSIGGKRLLEIGFGRGEFALMFAGLGAEVTAIETSGVAVERLSRQCRKHQIGNVTVLEKSAFEVAPHPPFDLVFGSMVLHHIEPFADFAVALRRLVAIHGRAFFYENNAAASRLAIWFRQHLAGRLWFPKYGDDEEFPLTADEVAALRSHFDVEIEYPEFRFFQMISLYVFRHRVVPGWFRLLDDLIFKVPRLRKYSYVQYVKLT